jgi:hypothetical protein
VGSGKRIDIHARRLLPGRRCRRPGNYPGPDDAPGLAG